MLMDEVPGDMNVWQHSGTRFTQREVEFLGSRTATVFLRPHAFILLCPTSILVKTGRNCLQHDNKPTHASHLVQSFLVKHQITQMIQPLHSPDLVLCNFWLFPKPKSPLKGKRFQTVNEIQENTTGQLMVIGRTMWGPKVPTLKGTEVSLSYIQNFLYLVSSSITVSIEGSTRLDSSGQTSQVGR